MASLIEAFVCLGMCGSTWPGFFFFGGGCSQAASFEQLVEGQDLEVGISCHEMRWESMFVVGSFAAFGSLKRLGIPWVFLLSLKTSAFKFGLLWVMGVVPTLDPTYYGTSGGGTTREAHQNKS